MSENKLLMKNGMWSNNPALVQLLGLCPLLAVSSTITNALGLGIATLLVLVGSNVTVSLIRNYVPKEIRIPVFVMIIASLVTCVQLLMNAYAYGLYLSLGIFIPLIVTNCIIIGRAEAYASKNDPLPAALDGFWMYLGMTTVLWLCLAQCVNLSVMAPCLMVQTYSLAIGLQHCAFKYSTSIAASYLHYYHQALSSG